MLPQPVNLVVLNKETHLGFQWTNPVWLEGSIYPASNGLTKFRAATKPPIGAQRRKKINFSSWPPGAGERRM